MQGSMGRGPSQAELRKSVSGGSPSKTRRQGLKLPATATAGRPAGRHCAVSGNLSPGVRVFGSAPAGPVASASDIFISTCHRVAAPDAHLVTVDPPAILGAAGAVDARARGC